EDVVGAVAEGLEHAGQADQRAQASREVVGLQSVGLIEGEVALAATAAVVVGAGVGHRAVGGQPGFRAVADEAGVGSAAGADDAGALVALFLPASRPAWWDVAASWCARSRRSYSTCPKAWSGGRSTRRSAMRRKTSSAWGLS